MSASIRELLKLLSEFERLSVDDIAKLSVDLRLLQQNRIAFPGETDANARPAGRFGSPAPSPP